MLVYLIGGVDMEYKTLGRSGIASSIASSPDRSACRSRDEVPVQLLAAAAATFDSDRDRAKACVHQAAELLRVSLEREGYRRNESSSRGGLAPWQAKRVVAHIESDINLSFRVADLAGIVQLSAGALRGTAASCRANFAILLDNNLLTAVVLSR